MNQPIKVIWKYKNNNRRTQYAQYIFIGETSSNLMKILNKIVNLNFYDTLINLSKDEYKSLEKNYGTHWYKFFFNNYHINSQIYIIKESTIQNNELTDKYGKEWVDLHIQGHQLMEKKIIYSYQSLIRDILESKNKKKVKEKSFEPDVDIKDFTTNKKLNLDKIFKSKINQTGGLEDDEEIDINDLKSIEDDDDDNQEQENKQEEDQEDQEQEQDDDKINKEDDENIDNELVQEETDVNLEELEELLLIK